MGLLFFWRDIMHKALYREYRPLVFDDVIGQDHIIRTLKNQIKEKGRSPPTFVHNEQK